MSGNINLTIIIPHYNTPELLCKLLKSIPDFEDIQVIVVDDNSNVGIDKYKQIKSVYSSRVEFYENITGVKSAGTCRNIGLEHAMGSWVLFADADDYFLPDMYSIVKKYFVTEYDIVFFTPTSVFIDTGEMSDRHLVAEEAINQYLASPSEENALALKSFKTVQPWSKLIKHAVIKKHHIRFSQSLHGNDTFFSAVLGYYAQNITASMDKIYCVTRSRGSLTTHMNVESYDIRLQEYIKRCHFLMEHYGAKTCKRYHVTGAGKLYMALQHHYGLKKYVEIVKIFKKNDIPIFNWYTLNPHYLLSKIRKQVETNKKHKKYYLK